VCGGTLIQHLGSPRHRQKSGGTPVHDVLLEGRMAEVFGTSRAPVNSRHHQAANRIGDGLIVTARDPEDGVIEGVVFSAARFAMGVQWHPEDMVNDQTQLRLFSAFANAMM
jgi:putative glutamine amidotransferase